MALKTVYKDGKPVVLNGKALKVDTAPALSTPYMVAEYAQVIMSENEFASYIKKAKLFNHTGILAEEFSGQMYLESIDMSDPSNNITIIESNAFAGAKCENTVIPNTVVRIGAEAFRNAMIGVLSVPGSVKTISGSAFENAQGIDGEAPTLQLNDGLETIELCAFISAAFTTIEIPATVTKIGEGCFGYSSITTVICKPTTPPTIEDNVFSGLTDFTIKVPAASIAAYKAADGWKDWADNITTM